MIVDENTGRVMPGRRWSDGLHQAVEAKENVAIERETRTYATITIQNYFRMYEKLGGHDRHRRDRGDRVQRDLPPGGPGDPDQQALHPDRPERLDLQDPPRQVQRGRQARSRRPTSGASPSWSARPASRLPRCFRACSSAANIVHTVLNAKFHQQEAEIVSRAGLRGRRDDRDQHGRPRHGHQAGRGRPSAGAPTRPGRAC